MEVLIVPFVVWLTIACVLGEEKMRPRISRIVLPLDVALGVRLAMARFGFAEAQPALGVRRDSGIGLEVLISTIEVIQHHVGIDLDARFVHRGNHQPQFRTTAVARFYRALLLIIAEVIMVVDAIAAVIDAPIALCGNGRPQAADASGPKFRRQRRKVIPPCAVLCLVIHRHIPIERLHHHIVQRLQRFFLLSRASGERANSNRYNNVFFKSQILHIAYTY